MSAPIRVLLIEDQVEDAELLFSGLRAGGLDFVPLCVDSPHALNVALDEFGPDLVLSDYSVPQFGARGGMAVLETVHARRPELPFIFISGTIGEERAIEALRRGASDYVMKNNRARLVPAVRRALDSAAERRARILAEQGRDESERRFKFFMQHLPGAAFIKSLDGRYVWVNPGAAKLVGREADDLIGSSALEIFGQQQASEADADCLRIARTGQPESQLFEFDSRNGRRAHLLQRFLIPNESGEAALIGGIAIDISDQVRAEKALVLNEERFRSISEATQEWIWEMDRDGRYTFCSAAAEVITAEPRSALIGRSSIELIYARAQPGLKRELARAIAEKRGWRDLLLRLHRKDGSVRWVDSNAFPLFDADGQVTGFRGAARDVTERVLQEQRLARLSRIHTVLSEINSALIRVSDRPQLFRDACRIAGEHGGFVMAWVGLMGDDQQVRPVAWHGGDGGYLVEITGPVDGVIDKALVRLALTEKRTVVVNDIRTDPQVGFREAALSRGYHSMLAMPLLSDQTPVAVMMLYSGEAGFFTGDELKLLDNLAADISFALGHLAKEERLAFVSYHDPLTGLPNRQLFFDRLGQLTQATRGVGASLALLVIDIDRFGFINDSMGRGAGDELLVDFARRLREAFSDGATPARISGGRFAIVVEGAGGAALALQVQERVQRMLAAPVQLGSGTLHVTAKIGISQFPQDGADAERLFMNAEAAVKRAKERAESLIFYAPELNARVAHRLQLESRMRDALRLRQFVLHYQPKVDLRTRCIVGVEALIRWIDPERGMVPPLEFIPLLEETGLIVGVGLWVLEQASADLKAWRAAGLPPPRIAVNVSQAQLRQIDFVPTVLDAVGAKPGHDVGIDLEITESLVMADDEAHIDKLRQLRQAGLRIHMDDFGTGYSSLGQIVRLPLDMLKIDRSFIIGMAEGNEHMAIVSMITGLARALKLQVVAEGVETEDAASLLESLGCDQGQGWLFSKPLTAEAFKALLATSCTSPPTLPGTATRATAAAR